MIKNEPEAKGLSLFAEMATIHQLRSQNWDTLSTYDFKGIFLHVAAQPQPVYLQIVD